MHMHTQNRERKRKKRNNQVSLKQRASRLLLRPHVRSLDCAGVIHAPDIDFKSAGTRSLNESELRSSFRNETIYGNHLSNMFFTYKTGQSESVRIFCLLWRASYQFVTQRKRSFVFHFRGYIFCNFFEFTISFKWENSKIVTQNI